MNMYTIAECRSRLTSDGLEGALEFHLVDTVMSGFAVRAAFGDRLLAGSTANAHAVDDETLLGAVTLKTTLCKLGYELVRLGKQLVRPEFEITRAERNLPGGEPFRSWLVERRGGLEIIA